MVSERDLRGLERVAGNVAMLARQIAYLTSLGLGRVARWDFTTDVRVLMGKGGSAVAIGGDGLVVDVVHCAEPELVLLF